MVTLFTALLVYYTTWRGWALGGGPKRACAGPVAASIYARDASMLVGVKAIRLATLRQ